MNQNSDTKPYCILYCPCTHRKKKKINPVSVSFKNVFGGLALWCCGWSRHLQCLQLIWATVLAALILQIQANTLGEQWRLAPAPRWEAQKKLPAPGFGLSQVWPLGPFGQWTRSWRTSHSDSPLFLCNSVFWENKYNFSFFKIISFKKQWNLQALFNLNWQSVSFKYSWWQKWTAVHDKALLDTKYSGCPKRQGVAVWVASWTSHWKPSFSLSPLSWLSFPADKPWHLMFDRPHSVWQIFSWIANKKKTVTSEEATDNICCQW